MINRAEQYPKDILQYAKNERASKKRSADNDLSQACLEGVGFYYRHPVSFYGKGNEYKRNSCQCCICGTQGGVFYINDGWAFCRNHKQAMYLPKEEFNRLLTEHQKKEESCHVS